MATQKPLVLLTGATGFVGFLTLLDLLRSGYRVRAAVRSQAKADRIRSTHALEALKFPDDSLSFVIITDMAKPGAFDEALQGATYAIHLAAPVPSFIGETTVTSDQYKTYYVDGLVDSHIGLLESATAAGVRRVVLTSSVMAVIPFAYFTGAPENDYSVRFGPDSRIPTPTGPFYAEFDSYAAGKIAALNATDEWIAKNGEKVALDVITILPSAVFGRNEQLASVAEMQADGTNTILLSLITGNKSTFAHNGNAVAGTDVARVHVKALDPEVKGNQSFLTSQPIKYEDALEVIHRGFPADVKAGRLSVEGQQPTLAMINDGSKVEEVLGIKYAPFEELVKQVAGLYLELSAKK